MSVDSKDIANPIIATGAFTSAACCAVDVTETIGWSASFVMVVIDSGGTNPNILIAGAGDTDESATLTGSTGVVTSPAVASGLDITATGFTVDSSVQVAGGTNYWFALK